MLLLLLRWRRVLGVVVLVLLVLLMVLVVLVLVVLVVHVTMVVRVVAAVALWQKGKCESRTSCACTYARLLPDRYYLPGDD